MTGKTSPNNARELSMWLFLLSVVISIITNIATSALPEFIKPYTWLSWLILGVLTTIYVYLNWSDNDDKLRLSNYIKVVKEFLLNFLKLPFSSGLEGYKNLGKAVGIVKLKTLLNSVEKWKFSVQNYKEGLLESQNGGLGFTKNAGLFFVVLANLFLNLLSGVLFLLQIFLIIFAFYSAIPIFMILVTLKVALLIMSAGFRLLDFILVVLVFCQNTIKSLYHYAVSVFDEHK